eukprot:UN23450
MAKNEQKSMIFHRGYPMKMSKNEQKLMNSIEIIFSIWK